MNFENKVVIVTGAARGLGQEYARHFARRGANVAVNDLRDCNETLEIIEQEGSAGIASTTDVTSAHSTREMAEAVVERFGRIDVLVNNAALYGSLTSAASDAMLTIDPPSCSFMAGKTALQHCHMPLTLTLMAASHSASSSL